MSKIDRLRSSIRGGPVVAPALVLALSSAWASASPQQWGVQIGTSEADNLEGVAPDGLGGTFEVGHTEGDLVTPNPGGRDIYLARRNAAGVLLWAGQFGTPSYEQASGLCLDGSGGVLVAGATNGSFGGPHVDSLDAIVARYDGAGNQLWVRQLGTVGIDVAEGVTPDGLGGCFLAGKSSGALGGASSGADDIWLARFDAQGSQQWITQFGSTGSDSLHGIASDGAGGVLLCGDTLAALGGPYAGGYDAWYASFDGAGNPIWIRQFGGTDFDTAECILPDGSGGCLVGGRTIDPLSGNPLGSAFVTRFDATGSALWSNDPPLPTYRVTDMTSDGLGGAFCLTQNFDDEGLPAQVVYPGIRQIASDGTEVFAMEFAKTPGGHNSTALASDGATGLVACGTTFGDMFGPHMGGFYDGWIARLDVCDFFGFSTYCTAGLNGTGKGASIDKHGSPYVSNNDLVLTVKNCPANQLGIFIMGPAQNNVPFGDGTLCVGGAIKRLLPAVGLGSAGWGSFALDVTDPNSPASQITPGSTWNFQFWYRDPNAGGAGFNLSNGLSATFCP